jgi:hypothetical protein
VSPILVRPVREQFEHDRVIRVLQAKYKRKYEVAINPGAEQNASVGIGDLVMYPDLVLFSQERNRRIHGTIEVETTESINTLEAMAEWAPFSKLKTPFFLYVPANAIDTARRLCTEHGIDPAEIWTYHVAIDQVRFTMVHRSADPPKGSIPEHKVKPVAPVIIDEPEVEEPAPAAAPAKPNKIAAAVKTPAAKGPAPKAAAVKTAAPKAANGKAAGAKSAPPKEASAKPNAQKPSPTKAVAAKVTPAKAAAKNGAAKPGKAPAKPAKAAKAVKKSAKTAKPAPKAKKAAAKKKRR